MGYLRTSVPKRAWGPLALTLVLFGATFTLDAAHAARATGGPQGPLVFVSNVLDLSAMVIEPKTGRVRKLPTGAVPHNWAMSPDGKEVLVVNTGSESVSFFDARTGDKKRDMLIAPIPKNAKHEKLGWDKFKGKTSCHQCHGPNAVGRLPSQVTYALDGKSLWTVPFNPPGIVRVDRATGKHLQEIEIKDPPFFVQASNVQYTPDGKEMVIVHRRSSKKLKLPTMGSAYDMPKDMTSFDHGAPPGNKASLITFHTPDGLRETGRVIVPLSLPFKVEFDKAGKLMYVAYRSSNKVAEIDVAKRELKRMLTVGEGPNNAIVDKRDGKWLYAPSFYDDPPEVVKLELKTGFVRALLPAKVSPAMVEQDADTGLLYAVINAGNRLLEIDPAGKGKITQEFPVGAFPLDVLVVPESKRKGRP